MPKTTPSTEIAVNNDGFEYDDMGIAIPEEAIARFDATNISSFVESLGLTQDDLLFQGEPFPFVPVKDELVGVPLFLVQWAFNDSKKFATETVTVLAVRLDTGERCSFFDSGTGIFAQLNRVTNYRIGAGLTAVRQGLSVPKGLVRSDYEANDSRPAGTTFYLG